MDARRVCDKPEHKSFETCENGNALPEETIDAFICHTLNKVVRSIKKELDKEKSAETRRGRSSVGSSSILVEKKAKEIEEETILQITFISHDDESGEESSQQEGTVADDITEVIQPVKFEEDTKYQFTAPTHEDFLPAKTQKKDTAEPSISSRAKSSSSVRDKFRSLFKRGNWKSSHSIKDGEKAGNKFEHVHRKTNAWKEHRRNLPDEEVIANEVMDNPGAQAANVKGDAEETLTKPKTSAQSKSSFTSLRKNIKSLFSSSSS